MMGPTPPHFSPVRLIVVVCLVCTGDFMACVRLIEVGEIPLSASTVKVVRDPTTGVIQGDCFSKNQANFTEVFSTIYIFTDWERSKQKY